MQLLQTIRSYCFCFPVLKRKREKQEGLKPTGLTSLKLTSQSYFKDQNPVQAKEPETDSVMEIYEPFSSDGFVSLNSDFAQSTPYETPELLNPLFWQIPCHFP